MASHIFSRFFHFPAEAMPSDGSHSRGSSCAPCLTAAVARHGASSLRRAQRPPGSTRLRAIHALLCNAVAAGDVRSAVVTAKDAAAAAVRLNPDDGAGVPEGGEEGLWSVVIPTYNRLPILAKCLNALEGQHDYALGGVERYEVVVVDDGSTDGTLEFLLPIPQERANEQVIDRIEGDAAVQWSGPTQFAATNAAANKSEELRGDKDSAEPSRRYPHVKVIRQQHGGATRARNLGVRKARGAVIVFIDSDLVVTDDFLRAHGAALAAARAEAGDDRTFTYGRVVNTANFEDPKAEKFKLTDNSAAFFATGNVALSRRLLLEAGSLLKCGSLEGPFDADFSEYGWEDLELGVRLKQVGARIRHVPLAVGYHWHPAFSMDQIPKLIDQERQRGRNGVRFFLKHPSLDVRLMTQLTPIHQGFWALLTLGGLLTEQALGPALRLLVAAGQPGLAAALLSPTLNWHTVQASKEEVKRLQQQGQFVKSQL